MPKPSTILLLAAASLARASAPEPLLRDGSALAGVDGTVARLEGGADANYIAFDSDDIWLFVPASDVNDYAGLVKAGTALQLLPSSTLEKLLADLAGHKKGPYRLWGTVTRYRGANYVFCSSVLPLASLEPGQPPEPNAPVPVDSARARPQPNEPPRPAPKTEPNAPAAQRKPTGPAGGLTDPNGLIDVPKEILDKIARPGAAIPRRIRPAARPQKNPAGKSPPAPDAAAKRPAQAPAQLAPGRLDSMLTDRTAFLEGPPGRWPVLAPDALGLSLQTTTLIPLPNEMLEMAQAQRRSALNRPRFRIAGIKTTFNGKPYLLLQNAVRAYSHGNFPR